MSISQYVYICRLSSSGRATLLASYVDSPCSLRRSDSAAERFLPMISAPIVKFHLRFNELLDDELVSREVLATAITYASHM